MDLIFTSQANHLHTAQFLVKEYGLKDTALIHLHSLRVPVNPEDFVEKVNVKLFSTYELLGVPHNIAIPNIYKLYRGDAIYARVMKRHQPKRIYLFGKDRAYNLLIKQGRKVGAEIYYIEEGLGTYAGEEIVVNATSFSGERFRGAAWKILDKRLIQPLWGVIRSLHSLIFLPYSLMRSVYDLFSVADIQIVLLRVTKRFSEFFEISPRFDKALVAFPELAKNTVRAVSYEQFDVLKCKTELHEGMIELPGSDNTVLFLSQKYAAKRVAPVYYHCLLGILARIAEDNGVCIDIKLHPREDRQAVCNSLQELDCPRLVLLEDVLCSAEYMVEKCTNYTVIIGITSSTLVYLSVLRPSVNVLSIGEILQESLIGHGFPRNLMTELSVGLLEVEKIFPMKQFQHGDDIRGRANTSECVLEN